MTQTTYYEFNKPEGTDLVNPLVDTNPNWDALDADLHEFNERSIANCTEVVALGVHTISRLDTTAKFLKWIATANYTAGETFTVDGLPVAATTPAGATLATNAYVTGSIVLACLNSDNTAMTVFVSGTTVASDAERLGGELPSYYGTASDVADNATDITNLQNQMGNTSIVGIGDGTATGAISAINADLIELEEEVQKMGMPTLDYTNYLHVFSSTAPSDLPTGATYGLTFTANKTCYLMGSYKAHIGFVKINNTAIALSNDSTDNLNWVYIPPLKLELGDTVTVSVSASGTGTSGPALHIFGEK